MALSISHFAIFSLLSKNLPPIIENDMKCAGLPGTLVGHISTCVYGDQRSHYTQIGVRTVKNCGPMLQVCMIIAYYGRHVWENVNVNFSKIDLEGNFP